MGHMHVNSDLIMEGGGSAHLALQLPRHRESSTSTAPSRNLDRSLRHLNKGTDLEHDATHATFDRGQASRPSTSSFLVPAPYSRRRGLPHLLRVDTEPYEIEATVSCTSDGLASALRRPARPSLYNKYLISACEAEEMAIRDRSGSVIQWHL